MMCMLDGTIKCISAGCHFITCSTCSSAEGCCHEPRGLSQGLIPTLLRNQDICIVMARDVT